MNIIEILERPSPAYYTVEELQFSISEYIFQKKNKRVEVNIYKNIPLNKAMNANDIFNLDRQYSMLMEFFGIVQQEYNKK